ncbi:ribosomal protein S20 (plastid) [Nitzschia inconspicua]|uniref:Ribosomal protein S20 n=1 Tax=Nitzschia inconspicua TaxID=303405 RepID=A0A8H2SIA7_9STRA|nr:ribosomal protein S20 [Nitzschia inconspicua]
METAKIDKTSQSKEKLQQILASIYSFLDKGTKKNVFHKNTVAKKKARLASYLRISS